MHILVLIYGIFYKYFLILLLAKNLIFFNHNFLFCKMCNTENWKKKRKRKRMNEKSKFMISNIWDIINDGIVHLISLSTKHIIITYIIISYHILLYVIFDQSNITLIIL